MIRKISILAALIAGLIFQNSAMAAEASKVAIVDIQRCISESNEGKRVSDTLSKEKDARQQRYNTAQKELSDLQKEIEKQSLMLSQDAKTSKQSEYEKKNRELTYLAQDLEEEQTASQQAATQKILKEIYTVVESVAKQQGFDLVLEKSNSGIIFTSAALDITDQVIKEYSKVKP